MVRRPRSECDVIEDQAAPMSLGAPACVAGAVRRARRWAAALVPVTTRLA